MEKSLNTLKMTTAASAEDIQCVKGLGDGNGGGSSSTTGLVDWQQKRSVDFSCYLVANSNIVSFLSRHCIVLVLF